MNLSDIIRNFKSSTNLISKEIEKIIDSKDDQRVKIRRIAAFSNIDINNSDVDMFLESGYDKAFEDFGFISRMTKEMFFCCIICALTDERNNDKKHLCVLAGKFHELLDNSIAYTFGELVLIAYFMEVFLKKKD